MFREERQANIQDFQKTYKMLSHLEMPVYSLIGNYDVRTLSQEDIAKMLGYERMYYSFDRDNYYFIAPSFVMTGDHTHDLGDIKAEMPSEQIEWLKADLVKTNKQVIVFIHYGLAEDDMKGNFWFESELQYALLENRVAVRTILEESGKVKAVLSGNQHWNRMKVQNNIPYFVVTSLTIILGTMALLRKLILSSCLMKIKLLLMLKAMILRSLSSKKTSFLIFLIQ